MLTIFFDQYTLHRKHIGNSHQKCPGLLRTRSVGGCSPSEIHRAVGQLMQIHRPNKCQPCPLCCGGGGGLGGREWGQRPARRCISQIVGHCPPPDNQTDRQTDRHHPRQRSDPPPTATGRPADPAGGGGGLQVRRSRDLRRAACSATQTPDIPAPAPAPAPV